MQIKIRSMTKYACAKVFLDGWVELPTAHTMSMIRLTSGIASRINVRIQFPIEMGLYSESLIDLF